MPGGKSCEIGMGKEKADAKQAFNEALPVQLAVRSLCTSPRCAMVWFWKGPPAQALALAMMAKAPIEAGVHITSQLLGIVSPYAEMPQTFARCKPTKGKRSKSTCPRD